ncbi:hypothetical protein TWF481_002942 [Arthrobotrys musiformis]|uniref:J domain-containing protein n=1 Tax=Arthrobotrys musiformis TaxID=47236 RepID=A0AAV9VRQ7_9PEZI
MSRPPGEEIDTYTEILGLNADASAKDLRRAYKAKLLQHHPDRNHGREGNFTCYTQKIIEAYGFLSERAKQRDGEKSKTKESGCGVPAPSNKTSAPHNTCFDTSKPANTSDWPVDAPFRAKYYRDDAAHTSASDRMHSYRRRTAQEQQRQRSSRKGETPRHPKKSLMNPYKDDGVSDSRERRKVGSRSEWVGVNHNQQNGQRDPSPRLRPHSHTPEVLPVNNLPKRRKKPPKSKFPRGPESKIRKNRGKKLKEAAQSAKIQQALASGQYSNLRDSRSRNPIDGDIQSPRNFDHPVRGGNDTSVDSSASPVPMDVDTPQKSYLSASTVPATPKKGSFVSEGPAPPLSTFVRFLPIPEPPAIPELPIPCEDISASIYSKFSASVALYRAVWNEYSLLRTHYLSARVEKNILECARNDGYSKGTNTEPEFEISLKYINNQLNKLHEERTACIEYVAALDARIIFELEWKSRLERVMPP